MQFGSEELRGDEWSSRPIFRAGKIPTISSLGLSLLPNPTETLATQTSGFGIQIADLKQLFELYKTKMVRKRPTY